MLARIGCYKIMGFQLGGVSGPDPLNFPLGCGPGFDPP